MKLKCLITGTGRSGTVYMARLLTSLGLICGHESIFDWNGLDAATLRLNGEHPPQLSYASQNAYENGQHKPLEKWLPNLNWIQAESSYLAAPFLKTDLLKDVPIIHVARDPVKVVNSFCNFIGYFKNSTPSNKYEEFIYRQLPELTIEMPAYDRCSLFWVRWNNMVENASPVLFHRVEDGPRKVMEFLGLEGEPFDDDTINTYRQNSSDQFFIDKIKSKEIRDQFLETGKRYGYKMALEYLLI